MSNVTLDIFVWEGIVEKIVHLKRKMMKRILTICMLLFLIQHIRAQSEDPCYNPFFEDSVTMKNYPKNLIDSATADQLQHPIKDGVMRGNIQYIEPFGRKICLTSFEPLPWLGKYTLEFKHYDIRYCNVWRISTMTFESIDDPIEEYFLGISFCSAFVIGLLVAIFGIPKVDKTKDKASQVNMLKAYKRNIFSLISILKFCMVLQVPVMVVIRTVMIDHQTFNRALTLSVVFWFLLLIVIAYVFRNIFINRRIVKLV